MAGCYRITRGWGVMLCMLYYINSCLLPHYTWLSVLLCMLYYINGWLLPHYTWLGIMLCMLYYINFWFFLHIAWLGFNAMYVVLHKWLVASAFHVVGV